MEELLKLKKYYEDKIFDLEKEKYKCKFMYEPEKNIKCKLNKIELECTKESLRTVNEDIEKHYQTMSSFNIFNPTFPSFPTPNFPAAPSFPAMPSFPEFSFTGFFGSSNPQTSTQTKSKSKSKSRSKSKSKSK